MLEHYIRDALAGCPTLIAAEGMATYRYTNTATDGLSLKLNERPIYGSSRLGSLRKQEELRALPSFSPQAANPIQQVDLNYELTDHLGIACPERSRRVTAVVTGRLLDGNGGGTPKQAELVSAQGYEPFGSLLPGRNYSSSSYDYGFNGMRKDDEMHGATGTSYDFGARIYDPRVGRWLSLDPLGYVGPGQSPYSFVMNSPILMMDPDGNWGEVTINKYYRKNGTLIKKSGVKDIFKRTVLIEKTIVVHGAKFYVDPAAGSNANGQEMANRVEANIKEVWNGTHEREGNNRAPEIRIDVRFEGGIKQVFSLDDVNAKGPESDDLWIFTTSEMVDSYVLGRASATVVGKNITLLSLTHSKNVSAHEFGHKADLPDMPNDQGDVMDNRYDIGVPNYREAGGFFGNSQGTQKWGDNITKFIKGFTKRQEKISGE